MLVSQAQLVVERVIRPDHESGCTDRRHLLTSFALATHAVAGWRVHLRTAVPLLKNVSPSPHDSLKKRVR